MNKKILFIFIIGLILRIAYVLLTPQISATIGDSGNYVFIARSLVEGKGYTNIEGKPDAYWAPGYPFFVSAVYKIFGVNYTPVRVVQSVLSGLLILLVFAICKQIFSPKIGLVAGVLTCIHPAFISYPGMLWPQSVGMFLIPLFILAIIKFNKSIWMSIIIGLIAGYATLLRAEMLLFSVIAFIMLVFTNQTNWRQILKYVTLMFIAMTLVISIWAFRNYRVFNKVILVSSHHGDTMWLSTWKEEWLEWQKKEPLISILNGRDRTEAAEDLFNAGLNNIKEHPFVYLRMCTKRLYRFWLTGHSNTFYFMEDSLMNYFVQRQYAIVFLKLTMLFFNVSIVLLGFCGIQVAYARFGQNRRYTHYLTMPFLFYVILHFFTFATPRYSVPVMPFVIIFASCSIVYYLGLVEARGHV